MGIFDYVTAGLRLSLIASVLSAAYQTNASSDPLVTALLVAVWGVQAAQALSSDSSQSLTADQSICGLLMAVVQTGFILALSRSVDLAYVWSIPALVVFLLVLVMDDPFMGEGKMQRYDKVRVGLLAFFLVSASIGEAFVFALDDLFFVALSTAQLSTTILLLVLLSQYEEPERTSAWKGGSSLLLSWAYLQLCVTPLLHPVHASLRISLVIGVLVNSALGSETEPSDGRCQAFAKGIKRVGKSALGIVALVLTSSVVFEWVAILGVALLTVSLNDPWWTSKVTFPDAIQAICRDALSLAETVAKPVYQFTSDRDVQRIMAVALPELAGVRSAIYRLLVPIWGSLLDGANGRTFTLFPVGNFFAMAAFLVGPLFVLLGLLAKLFPEGRFFVQSQWFWAAGLLGNLVFVVFTQLTPDTSVFFVYSTLDDTTYTRAYTKAGTQALVAQCLIVGTCVVLYVQRAVDNAVDRVGMGGEGDSPTPSEKDAPVRRRCAAVRDWIDYLTSASLVLFVVAVLILMLTISSTGSPISSIKFDKRPQRQPDWLISTTIDKVSALTVSFFKMLNPKPRLIVLTAAIVNYGIEQINCWGCLCVPDVQGAYEDALGGLIGAGNAIGGAFGFRRRLLGFSPANTLTFGPTRTSGCQPVSCNRGLVRVCIMDVVADGVEKMTDLTLGAVDFVFEQTYDNILKHIPIFSTSTSLLSRLPRIDVFRDFDVFKGIRFSFQFKFLGVDFGVVPSLGLPSLPSSLSLWSILPLLLIVLLGAYLARKLGISQPVWAAVSASVQVTVISLFLTALIAVAALYYFLINEARIQGYDVHLKPNSNLWMYALGMGVMALSLFLKVGEASQMKVEGGTRGRWIPLVVR